MAQSVASARIGSFRFSSARAIPAQCPGAAPLCATAPRSANCQPISMSCRVPGRALTARSNATLRLGASWTTGPRACRSRTPSWTCSKRGSGTCSTNCLGRRDDVRRLSHDRAAASSCSRFRGFPAAYIWRHSRDCAGVLPRRTRGIASPLRCRLTGSALLRRAAHKLVQSDLRPIVKAHRNDRRPRPD